MSPVSELRLASDDRSGFDLSLPVGDLPRLLGAQDTPPPLAVRAAADRVAHWRERLAALGPAPYLGVTWRAGTKTDDAPEFAARGEDPLYKEIDIAMLATTLRAWPGTVLVLQRLPQQAEVAAFAKALGRAAHDLSATNDDLVDMAALLHLIDDYVGVSNTNMHLRAGVGRTARVLIPFPPEFRWMSAGNEAPWFRGFRIYREPPNRDWQPVMNALREDIGR
jgi:ADP-heptose:LPS heptosyltransferase